VIADPSGRIMMLNAQAEELFGYAQSELVGRPVEVLVPAPQRSVHALHRGAYTDHPRTRPMGAGLQLMARRKNGSEFPVEISLSPVQTRDETLITAVVRDITERRRSEDAIRAQAQLLDLAQDAIIVLGRDGRVQYWNNGAEYTYGWTAEEALGRPLDELLQSASPGSHEEMMQALSLSNSWEGELEHTRQDGRRIIVASRIVVQRAPDGTLNSIMEINRDITERRQLERDRERLLLESDRQQDRERIGMDLHDGIIQSIYAVSLGLEAAAEDVASEPEAAQRAVNTAIDQLGDVIRDVRSYIFELRPSRFSSDLGESFEEMIRDFEKGASMRVESHIEKPLPELAEDECAMLFHIAREALTNARKHANASVVRIGLRREGERVRLTVEDDGAGFDATARHVEDRRGLRNMQMRATTIGAEFKLESTPGAGTMIAVHLPIGERERVGS
jgi:PAS domain S-box-containing protein